LNYHLVLTRRCNLNCMYCHGGEETGPQTEVQYSLEELERFLSSDADTQLMFYGGEPCLRIPLLVEIMDRFPDARFMLQTNALLLNQIPEEYVHRIHSILVSIDGRKATTDFYRSAGVYERVLNNVRWLEQIGFQGDIVARMAVSQQSDIYKDVKHLLGLRNPGFKHVHWQLNVIWDAEGNWVDFPRWVEDSYKPGIDQLADEWVSAMERGEVQGIVPFLPLTYTLLTGEPSELRCGAGIDTFAIHVDGSIGVCPISPDWEFSIVGDVRTTEPSELYNIMGLDEPCPTCGEFGVCGGRCLFANKQRLWGEDGFRKVCNTVRHLVEVLKHHIPRIEGYLEQGLVHLSEFNYPEYNNGCEIIP
jgi:putative peptide-modifying radical SAM enzyme